MFKEKLKTMKITKPIRLKNLRIMPVLFLLSIIALSFQSCATVFGGRSNTLVFPETNELDARVYIDDTLVGEAKGKLILPKKTIQHGSKLEIRAEGCETREHMILLKPHTGYVIANFIVGAVPLIVDFATGDILRPHPRKFEEPLEKTEN